MMQQVDTTTATSFESGLEKLESLVRRMETEQLTLEEAMAAYADGMRLSRALDEQLNQTEKQLVMLSMDPEGMSAAQEGTL